jgi:hypothetical protein
VWIVSIRLKIVLSDSAEESLLHLIKTGVAPPDPEASSLN